MSADDQTTARLAQVGDVIERGQTVAANVRSFTDEDGSQWWRNSIGHFHLDPDDDPATCRDNCLPTARFPDAYGPLKVVEVDPEPQPAVGMCARCGERRPANGTDVCWRCERLSALGEGTATGDNQLAPPPQTARDPGTFADCVRWLIAADLGQNADRRIDRMAAQHQELQARYDTVVSDRETLRASLNLRKERCRKEHGMTTDESGRSVLCLPEVPEGAVALVGGESGTRWTADGQSRLWWRSEYGVVRRLHDVLGAEGGVTVEFAPPREPRTWPKLEEIADWPEFVNVTDYAGVSQRFNLFAGRYRSDARQGYWTLHELRQLGDVTEATP
jgi:hypothetical protein